MYQALWKTSSFILSAAAHKVFPSRCLVVDHKNTAAEFKPDNFYSLGGFYSEFVLINSGFLSICKEILESKDTSVLGELNFINKINSVNKLSPSPYTFLNEKEAFQVWKEFDSLCKGNYEIEKLDVGLDFIDKMFSHNPFMSLYLKSKLENGMHSITLYKLNDYFGFSDGSMLSKTGYIKENINLKQASSHFLLPSNTSVIYTDVNKQDTPSLNRLYGISFFNQKDMKEYQEASDRIAQSDHRLIGKTQDLFMLHKHSPGSPFFLKYGTRIVNRMLELLRNKYLKYSFDEVITPQIFYKALWQTSGHWDNYSKDMFAVSDMPEPKKESSRVNHSGSCCGDIVNSKDDVAGLKPMNCPGHCLIFASKVRSYRDLPLRIADLGPVHRNEPVGTLTGLTRVRRFHQDDGHIFCTLDSIKTEISDQLQMLNEIYSIFKFSNYDLSLSTRPKENYIGTLEQWDKAEELLKLALNQTQRPWTENEGDGAFYGPKIDVYIQDALGRKHQTATIQLDFQLPKRFKLKYVNKDSKNEEPVIIHRAIFGSIERMLAILSEHYSGKWPFWLSPRQALLVPILSSGKGDSDTEHLNRQITEYSNLVYNELRGGEFSKLNGAHNGREKQGLPMSAHTELKSDINSSDKVGNMVEGLVNKRMSKYRFFVDLKEGESLGKLGRVVKTARLDRYNYLIAIGSKEMKNRTVNVRAFNGKEIGEISLIQLKDMFMDMTDNFE